MLTSSSGSDKIRSAVELNITNWAMLPRSDRHVLHASGFVVCELPCSQGPSASKVHYLIREVRRRMAASAVQRNEALISVVRLDL